MSFVGRGYGTKLELSYTKTHTLTVVRISGILMCPKFRRIYEWIKGVVSAVKNCKQTGCFAQCAEGNTTLVLS
jgi:hypothetical protein